ncbi:MAG TPA: ABC transporter permease [Bryobacteraceae bacterium]|nr:ABC transporter permease [Bryobacteraceae bacterium]
MAARVRFPDTMSGFLQDFRFTLRAFRKRPAFIFTAVLVLALGLGANTAIFSIVNAMLLRPLPFRDPGRLARLYERGIGSNGALFNSVAPGTFFDWQKLAHSFEAMAGYMTGPITLAGPHDSLAAERVDAAGVTWQFFSMLGVQPIAGRTFTAAEDRHGAPRVALVSWGLWQSRFGGASGMVGRHIRLDGQDALIIGILPRGFTFPARGTQLWIPAAIGDDTAQRHDTHFLSVIARLRPGVALDQARQEIDAISARYRRSNPGDAIARGANALPLQEALVRDARPGLLLLLAAVGCVLLISCVNVANLLLARGSGRTVELAIRSAAGAGRPRLVRLLMAESILLALCGAAAGLAFAAFVGDALAARAPGADAVLSGGAVPLDGRVFAFAVAAALAVGIASGLLPALRISRRDLAQCLREGGRSATEGRAHGRFRRALAAVEVALSLVLVIAAGLLGRSFAHLLATDSGVRTDHTITVMIPWLEMPDARAREFFRELPQRLDSIPGVLSAGLSNCLPVDGHCNDNFFYIEGHPNPPGQTMDALQRNADPAYFAAIGIPLLRGRVFTPEDGVGPDPKHPRRPVILISQSLAKTWFGVEDPIGKRIYTNAAMVRERATGIPAPHYEIVGIVGDVPDELGRPPAPTFYMPLADATESDQIYAVLHTRGEPHSVIAQVRAEVRRLNPDLAVDRVRTVRDLIGQSAADQQFHMLLFGSFAALSLLLAGIGLYGVLSFAVAQRRAEIGVRMALGAGRREVAGLILREGMRPVLAGVAAGLPAAALVCRLLRSLLYGTAVMDPATFALAPLLLMAVAALACYLPALRAARIDPAVTLRGE